MSYIPMSFPGDLYEKIQEIKFMLDYGNFLEKTNRCCIILRNMKNVLKRNGERTISFNQKIETKR